MKEIKIKKKALNISVTKFLLRGIFFLALIGTNRAKADNCAKIGEIGDSGVCNGMLIVDKEDLKNAIADDSYSIQKDGVNYTFGDDANNVYTGNIKSFSNLFKGKTNFNEDIGYWDISKANSLKQMFDGATSFNQDISNWRPTEVKNMAFMFRNATSFNNNSQSLDDWGEHTSNVEFMQSMFFGATSFNQDIGSWRPTNVKRMNSMFRNATSFNKNLNGWGENTSNVEDMSLMFRGASNFNKDLNNWNTGKVETMREMFRDATAFNGSISSWNVKKVENFTRIFQNAKNFDQSIRDWVLLEAVYLNGFLLNANAFNQDISNWDVRHIAESPKNFSTTTQTNYKGPCWGNNGCAENSDPPILQNNYTPTGHNVSLSNDFDLILEFDKAIKAGTGKPYLQLWVYDEDRKNPRFVKKYTFWLKREGVADFSEVDGYKKLKILNFSKHLEHDKKYYIYLPPTAILARDNNVNFDGIQGGYKETGSVWFSTGSDTPLTILGTTPDKTQFLETEEPKIKIVFNEPIALGTGNIELYKSSDDSSPVKNFNVETDLSLISTADNELNIILKNDNGTSLVTKSTKYYLLIDNTAIKDISSTKTFAGILNKNDYSFTTISAEKCGAITGQAKYWRGKGAPSTTVKIYKEKTLVSTETTNAVGDYSFFPTEIGTYNVEFIKPSEENEPSDARAAAFSSSSLKLSGRWVKNIEVTSACEIYSEIDGILVDPKGIIYDSNTRQPVAGATVNFLYNGRLVSNEWLDDSGGQNPQITSSDGEYSFILKADKAADGIYTIQVSPPSAYKFESSQILSESETYKPQLGAQIEEIQPQETAPNSNQDATYYLSFSFEFGENSANTSNGIINNHIPVDTAADPTSKADVVGLIDAWTQAAIRFQKSSIEAVNKRFNWLRSNQNSDKKSHQGINISFVNPFLEKTFNGSTKRFKDLKSRDLENWAKTNWSGKRQKNKSDQVFNEIIDNSVNLAFAELREKTFDPNLNQTGEKFIGNWSLWSNGKILIGNSDSGTNSSGQDTNSFYLTLGIDKPYKENSLFGMAFTYGEDDISVGNLGSGIDSTNLGLNFYSSNVLKNKFPLETQIGFGKMNMNTTRMDNFTSHKGNRDIYMIFGSTRILAEPLKINKFQLTPYGKLELAHIKFNEFSESGSSLALTFKDQTVNRKTVSLGLNLDRNLIFKNWKLKPFLGISYGYDFNDDSIVDMNYVNDAQNYRIILDKLSSEQWNTNLGFEFYKNNDWSGSLSYEYEKTDITSHSNSYQFNLNWFF